MSTGGKITNNWRNAALSRAYTNDSTYTQPTKFKVGIGTTTPTVNDTDLEIAVPIENGTIIDAGTAVMTGYLSADSSTSNTAYYKEGGGLTDVTAQSLIKSSTATNESLWSLESLSTTVSNDQPYGCWFRIASGTAYDSLDSNTAVEVRIGSSTANYYRDTYTKASVTAGWNWLTSNTANVSTLTEVGSVSTTAIATFGLYVVSSTATDTYTSNNLTYDLFRQWEPSDLLGSLVSGYPSLDTTNIRVTLRYYLTSIQGNGFPLTEVGAYNTDDTSIMSSRDVFDSISKSLTDEVAIEIKDSMED